MKFILLVSLMATNAVAFERIFAINAGGEEHKDSDGIIYDQHLSKNSFDWNWEFPIKSLSDQDLNVYKSVEYSDGSSMKYDMSVKNDGFYVLIAKFSYVGSENQDILKMTLNYDIPLISNMDQYQQCGSNVNICDEYFYFCAKNQTLYYENRATVIRNGEIHIEIRPVRGEAHLAGLVLLKGALGESHKLNGSATNKTLHFDAKKMNPKCLQATESTGSTGGLNDDRLNPVHQTSIENSQKTILREIQSFQKLQSNNFINRFEKVEQQISKISKEIKSEVCLKKDDHTNRKTLNIEALQTGVQQLVDDCQFIKAEQESMKLSLSEVKKEFKDFKEMLVGVAEDMTTVIQIVNSIKKKI
jgi:Malectin domain